MQVTVKWLDNVSFVGQSGSGHSVVMDGPEDKGGQNLGIRPMEMVLLGLGGCASFDVVSILKKQRQNIHDCKVEIKAQRADAIPSVFTNIELVFYVQGQNLDENKVNKAVALSVDKYCSVSDMLENGQVKIQHSLQLIDEDTKVWGTWIEQ